MNKVSKTILFCFFLLITFEIILEIRAKNNGWETLLLSSKNIKDTNSSSLSRESEFGPTKDFPYRSVIIKDVKKLKEQNKKIIWLASSSHADDGKLDDEKIFPSILNKILSNKAVIINASKKGALLIGHIDNLKTAVKYKPELSLLYQMSNDISFYSKGLKISLKKNKAANPGLSFVNLDKLTEQTTIFSIIKTNFSSLIVDGLPLKHNINPDWIKKYKSEVKEFIQNSIRIGAKPILCTFAISHTEAQQIPMETKKSVFRFNNLLSLELWIKTVNQLNKEIKTIAQKNNFALIDLDLELSGKSDYFRDFIHFNEEGHKKVAEIIARRIEDEL